MRSILLSLLFTSAVCFNLSAQEKLQSDGEIPILAWIGIPADQTTVERFRELKNCGININFTFYPNIAEVQKALDAAKKAGVKIMPFCPELKNEPEKTVKALMKHPALYGYHLRDEPLITDFAEIAEWIKKVQSVNSKHGSYINLYPNDDCVDTFFGKEITNPIGQSEHYAEYVDLFLKEVPVPYLSFDHYPITQKDGVNSLKRQWYENLEIIAAAAKKANIPFWAFALSAGHTNPGSAPGNPYPTPTVADLKLQMYSNLAYGARGLQYFTYWGHSDKWMEHTGSPMTVDGKRTEVYDYLKLVNDEIQTLAPVFLNSKVLWVRHTGTLPLGTKALEQLPSKIKELKTDGGAVVSLLEKGTRQFLVVVNRESQKPMKLTIKTDDDVKKVLKDATLIPTSTYAETTEVDAGDTVIFAWDK
ncbi:MAG: beta-galactosidase [Dysgonamonadaceae bacterium]|jgi:hypothetical protein|nr:beta-galactosidase [Dysgonamonadaceae bacterium]